MSETSVRAEKALFEQVRAAYAWEAAQGVTQARSVAGWIEAAVDRHARLSSAKRRAVTLRFPPVRYALGNARPKHTVRLSPEVMARVQEANAADRELYSPAEAPGPDLARHTPSDLIATALRAAVARCERKAGGALPPAPARLPRRAASTSGKKHVSVTVSAPASFHAALVDLHASSEKPLSYTAWITAALDAWAAMSDTERAEARARFRMPAPRSRDDERVRRSYRVPAATREALRPIERSHPATVLEALAWQLDVGLTLL
ncbi:hypothetical protein EVU97_14435 [Dermacoccus sp. 147Ba]|uniref:hypothetical protein n=1 Tax=Dermacoccus sp. 147Ba TaxID=2510111 RepID=UPI00101BF973|nr:hypothetical protein [Dermacoccus sp. 147Ba]RYI20426.1 hypothetical protein EVU97_14435 [Dermacoccus sp. 147Ba]